MRKLAPLLLLLLLGCKTENKADSIPSPSTEQYASSDLNLDQEEYYDKILGALVGSAIGDAMGASTEMWHRNEIQSKYGYITGLTPAIREQSPEGTWDHNLMAGATTDDTRWKSLMVSYFKTNDKQLTADNFAHFIAQEYQSLTRSLANEDIQKSTDALDQQIEKIDWIKEWARVALAYEDSQEAYVKAQNRFYGGEMSCAGQLYSPMIGLISKTPLQAYEKAYELSLFDIGYAKDISALVSAMTHMAMRTQNMDSIMNVPTFIDPMGYADSRLVGRIPFALIDGAQTNVHRVNELVLVDSLIEKDSLYFKVPKGYIGPKKNWVRQEMLYQLLEKDKRGIAFHSAEIWQILVTGLEFGNGDFEKTMQFIVNYGRDNDTVSAVAGMILGAKLGYSHLPKDLKEKAVQVNKEYMGIDLEQLAKEMTN
ncbi:MAG: ADP-ribosylglycohydrolase family protein [Maribacter sp.]